MNMTWDQHCLLVGNQHALQVEIRLIEELGLVSGNDFLVRRPGWVRVNGKRRSNGSLTAFIFTGTGENAIMAKLAV
jgi:hypothetical protein